MKTENKKTAKNPIAIVTIAFMFTQGLYKFYCKTTVKILNAIIAIMEKRKQDKTDFDKLAKLIWVVNHMANKLQGICSISTSVHDNCRCKMKQKIKDCICKFCYAYNQQSYQTGLKEHNILNGFILRNVLIPVESFKNIVLMFPYLRIESFGDVANIIQARNYIRIIKAFPEKRCVIFSKNIDIWEKAFKEEGKPKNTTYVHSSHFINKIDNINLERYNFIDHIFTVFTKEYAKKNNIVINCGGKKCMECINKKQGCFYKTDVLYINELKK